MNYDLAMKRRRRGSLPVASMRRRGSADHHKDLRKLLDKRSDELLQQRQQYRIFENRFKQEEVQKVGARHGALETTPGGFAIHS